LLLAVVASSASAVAVAAEFGDAVPTRIVKFGDLNLSSDDGAAVLYRRIKGAAKAVCELSDVRPLDAMTAGRRCTDEAIERAVVQVNAPLLTRFIDAKTGMAAPVVSGSAAATAP